jgi:glycosyltransferase involved in cell wall biosynthesis
MVMQRMQPLVSVIIPTLDRPYLVGRAVRSALAQTLRDIEVIVVQDGPNDATVEALGRIDDPRLRVRVLPQRVGSAHAYNAGVDATRAPWVAFLDDDDEFLPTKLELQLTTARLSRYRYPIVLCRLIGRAPSGDRVWPRRLPRPDEPLSEWLFCRRNPFFGEGLAQSDMFLTSKELLKKVPLAGGLQDNDDIDWFLRASAFSGAGVEFAPTMQPLAIWYLDEARPRMSLSSDWRYALSWLKAIEDLLTPRAFASFALTWIGSDAARLGDCEAFQPLLRAAFQHGQPSAMDLLTYLAHWLIPEGPKRRIAAAFARRQARTPG